MNLNFRNKAVPTSLKLRGSSQKGFTLVELLVVLVIIGILATFAVVSLNNARQKARDARRISDVRQIMTALEMYFNDVSIYPTLITNGGTIANGSTVYMQVVPSNITPYAEGSTCTGATAGYVYTQSSSNSTYTLTFCLGGAVSNLAAGFHTAYNNGMQ